MNIFNLVYKIKNPKTEKSCAVDRLKMAYITTFGELNLHLKRRHSTLEYNCLYVTVGHKIGKMLH